MNVSTIADANGNYSFSGLASGTYTITPSKNGVVFEPPAQTVTIYGSSVTANFTGLPPLQSISISANSASIFAGSTDQFAAIGTFSDGSTQNLTNSVIWTSSNPAVATVSATGLATGLAPGSSNITAAQNGVSSNAVSLTVSAVTSPATLQSITVTAPKSSLPIGSSESLTAMGTFSDGTTQNLTSSAGWTASNPGAVSIGNGALALAAGVGQSVISATQAGITGTATISATATISGSVTPASSGAGTTITLSGTASATTTTDVNGNYSFTVPADGPYTVTPAKSLYSFSPQSTSVTVNNVNISSANFTVTVGQMSMSPSTFSFGNVNVGSTSQIQATLTATGGDVILTNDAISGSGFGISGITFPLTISSGKSASFSANFSPAAVGAASATLSLSNSTTTVATATLSGAGAGLSVSPTSLNFGQVLDGTTSSPQTLTLSAVGGSVTMNSSNIVQNGGGGNAFSLTGLPSVPFTISPGQTVQVSVVFAPAAGSPGTAAGSISFASNINGATPSFAGTGMPNVLLTWGASTTQNVTYNVYRCAISAAVCTQNQPSNFTEIANRSGNLSYVDSAVTSGQTYYYAITAVDVNGIESVFSTIANATVP